MEPDLILQGERYVTLAHAEAVKQQADGYFKNWHAMLDENVALRDKLAEAKAASEERRDALRNLLCEGHDAEDYKHTPDNTGCVLCDLKRWEETMKGMSANLAEARATKDMHKERAQELEAKLAEAERIDRLAASYFPVEFPQPTEDGRVMLRANVLLKSRIAEAEKQRDEAIRRLEAAVEMDPACAAGTCDCSSKPAPTGEETRRSRDRKLADHNHRIQLLEGRMADQEAQGDKIIDDIEDLRDYGARARDADLVRFDKLEQRQIALDGEVSGWREMVNGLRFALNDLDRVVGRLMERVNNLEDKP